MRTGVRVGVDVGSVRVGVASCDPGGILATPVTTLRRDLRSGRDIEELGGIVAEREAIEVLVGLPRTLAGRDGPSAVAAREYAAAVAGRVAPVPVRLVDERLSTVAATRGLRAAGVPGRSMRAVVDAAAAVVLLQAALDTERATDRPPGDAVS
jgi:putative Holliday junction resolvase